MGLVAVQGHPVSARRGAPRPGRRGTVLLLLFIVSTVLFILSLSIANQVLNDRRLTNKYGEDTAAYYTAQAGIDHALWRLRNLLEEPLVHFEGVGPKDPGVVNEPLLDLMDYDKARDWARTFVLDEDQLMPEAHCTVHAELVNVRKNRFYANIDRVEPRVPESLERFREQKDNKARGKMKDAEGGDTGVGFDDDVEGVEALGGWSGELRITAHGQFRETRRTIEIVRELRLTDITPPAPDHTLFIQSKQPERLEMGRFILSNLDLPDSVAGLLHKLTMRANDLLRLSLSEDKADVLKNVDKIQDFMTNDQGEGQASDALQLVFELASNVQDEAIKDKVDSIILSLNPRNWGRVRTNGTLYVKLPFFAADDIINYFADNTIFGHQRPEVGFLYHDNRLHDPYLGVYTHFQGLIYKQYRRLNPLSMGPSTEPTPVAPQRYTINTQFNYVDRHPDRREPKRLKEITRYAREAAHIRFKDGRVRFQGTPGNPIQFDGIWWADRKLDVGGPFQGRGLVIAKGDIMITSSLTPMNPGDRVSLVSLEGKIILNSQVNDFEVEAGLYAKNGIKGTKSQTLNLKGNLVVDRLHRKNMPKYFTCQFDPNLKNHMVDNIVGVISRQFLSYRETGAGAVWTPARITADVQPWVEAAPAAPPKADP